MNIQYEYLSLKKKASKQMKLFDLFNIENWNLDQENINYKLSQFNFLKFIDIQNSTIYFELLTTFSTLFGVYIAQATYNIFNKYILNINIFRKKKYRHIFSLYSKIINAKFQIFPYILKNCLKFFTQKYFQHLI